MGTRPATAGVTVSMNIRSSTSVLLALLSFAGFSCGSTADRSELQTEVILYDSGSEVSMHVGLTQLQLTETGFLELESIGDGRCPPDVNCIWEGEVVGFFRVGSLEEMSLLIQTDGIIQGFAEGKTGAVHSLSGTPQAIFELDGVRYELVPSGLIVDGPDLVGLEIVVTTL